jgi:hypothetical protein
LFAVQRRAGVAGSPIKLVVPFAWAAATVSSRACLQPSWVRGSPAVIVENKGGAGRLSAPTCGQVATGWQYHPVRFDVDHHQCGSGKQLPYDLLKDLQRCKSPQAPSWWSCPATSK